MSQTVTDIMENVFTVKEMVQMGVTDYAELTTIVWHSTEEPISRFRQVTASVPLNVRAHMTLDTNGPILPHLKVKEENGTSVRIFRVPHYMKTTRDYEPLELFVGFYRHTSLVLDDPMHLDLSKLAIAREFCRGPQPNVPPTSTTVSREIRDEAWTEFVASFDTSLMEKARKMYDGLKFEDETKAESEDSVVILDTLFILAYFRYEYSFNDCWNYDFQSVFERSRFIAQRFPLLRDLLMLENQVPMCLLLHVMHYIHRTGMTDTPEVMLYNLLQWFVITVYPFNHGVKLDVSSDVLQLHLEGLHKRSVDSFVNCDHLLHCAYLAICGPYNPPPDETSDSSGQFLPCFKPGNIGSSNTMPARNKFRIPPATSLKRVGILVKVANDSLTVSNIKFERQKHKSVLLVPKLIMNDSTASVLRNLALYEQIKDNGYCTRGDIRTYLYMMSSLLDSVQDVRLMVNRGVIVNQLGSADAVCKQWNQMCDGLYIPSLPPAYWSDIQDRISELERSRRQKWVAEIQERNFSSLIVSVSFLVFCILFIATVLQAVFSVLSYTGG